MIMKAVFTNFDNTSNWVNGKCGRFTFEAKLFDVGSCFGINDGRVSKLNIYNNKTEKNVVNYDRGWDIRPRKGRVYFQKIMELLENSPKRFENETDPIPVNIPVSPDDVEKMSIEELINLSNQLR